MTITEDAFVAEARKFLDANAQPRVEHTFRWGEGPDTLGFFEESTPEVEARRAAETKRWQATQFDAGFGWIDGPPEYGGRGLPTPYDRRYRELSAEYDTPSLSRLAVSVGMVAPTILAHGIPEVRDRYLRKLYRADLVACQLFSEPGAGSDLASVATRAVRDGDGWRVDGQKVWTSGAQHSDLGELVARTSPEKPKHQGITTFLVDMHAPGVEVRPLRQMTGGATFNEVFFENVSVPDTHRLGDVDGGWPVALTTLMNERAAIGGELGLRPSFERLRDLARHVGRDRDPLVRQALADAYVHLEVAHLTHRRGMARVEGGRPPGPEMSIAKLASSRNSTRVAEVAALVLGARLVADTGEWG